jgi:hypothetical protein
LVVDNGAAYRATTLQQICARLGITLIHCRPYMPESKGKLERWHRTLRGSFLSEIGHEAALELSELNARLWAWTEQIYHHGAHAGLAGVTPLARYQQDLAHIRTLGTRAAHLDSIFHHRLKRDVRKDGTVSYLGRAFEVPYELSGKRVWLVVDPHSGEVVGVEDEAGNTLGAATPLDLLANAHRRRRKPGTPPAAPAVPSAPSLLDLAVARHYGAIPNSNTDQDPTTGAI